MICNSDYDGDDPGDAGTGTINYTVKNLYDDALSFDFLYSGRFRIAEGHSLTELAAGQKLILSLQNLNENGIVDSVIFFDTDVGDTAHQDINISAFTSIRSIIRLVPTDLANFAISDSILNMSGMESLPNRILFTPIAEGMHEGYLVAVDSISGITKDIVKLSGKTTGYVDVHESNEQLPFDYRLYENYPNPFNSSTEIRYSIRSRSHVMVSIYNLLGQKIRTLVDEEKPAGNYIITWNGTANNGDEVATGIYFYQIRTRDYVETRKMMLLK
jgi:hypothetical protein